MNVQPASNKLIHNQQSQKKCIVVATHSKNLIVMCSKPLIEYENLWPPLLSKKLEKSFLKLDHFWGTLRRKIVLAP